MSHVYRRHAPPLRGPGALCRFIRNAWIAMLPEDVTCDQCIAKMRKQGVPRSGWAPLTVERAWPTLLDEGERSPVLGTSANHTPKET